MHEKPRILVVEADPADRSGIRRAIEREFPGCEVADASEPGALDAVLRHPAFDVAVIGHGAGWADGLELTARIRAAAPTVGIVMFTDAGSEDLAVAAMKEGLDDYVAKAPGRVSRLTSALRSAISRRAQARRASDAERRFKRLFDHAPVGIFRTAPDGRILDANPMLASVLGTTSPRDLIGRSAISFYVDPRDRETWTTALQAGQEIAGFEVGARRLDGHDIRLRISARAIPGDDGRAEAYEGVIEDVTERHEAEHRLRDAERRLRHAQKMEAIGRLAGGVAHDYNNLLTVILGHASLIEDALGATDAQAADDVRRILEAGRRATDLTKQLLALSQQQVGPPQRLDPADAIDVVVPMLQRLLGEEGNLRVEPADRGWLVRIDPAQLAQIVLNLAVRARDAMPGSTGFALSVRHAEIAGEDAARTAGLFPGQHVSIALRMEDASRGDREPSPADSEMPSIETIVREWGGALRRDARSFEVLLPRAADDETRTRPRDRPRPPGVSTILVVEDDEGLRDLVARALQREGHEVLSAADAAAAMDLAAGRDADVQLLVTDVVMPGLSGIELAAKLRARSPSLRTIFMTGFSRELARRPVELPRDAHWLRKPFTLQELSSTVRGALGVEAG